MKQVAVKEKSFYRPEMSQVVFSRFSEFIYDKCGVKMPPEKKTMLTSRLNKRLSQLGMKSFKDYYDYVSSARGLSEELVQMINVVTTNKTDFFREPAHFDFMMNNALPDIIKARRISDLSKLIVWSAGCSSGEEPYTLCMFLSEFFEKRAGDFSVLATDISTKVLDMAKKAIYSEDVIEPVKMPFRKKYLMRGKGSQDGFYRVVPELRKRVNFMRLNLLEGRDFGIRQRMDIIFCRNVIIYFDRQTQTKLFQKYYSQLRPGGYMFIGHSETLHGINDDFMPVGSAVYKKPL